MNVRSFSRSALIYFIFSSFFYKNICVLSSIVLAHLSSLLMVLCLLIIVTSAIYDSSKINYMFFSFCLLYFYILLSILCINYSNGTFLVFFWSRIYKCMFSSSSASFFFKSNSAYILLLFASLLICSSYILYSECMGR